MRISVFGLGYVGIVTGACLAQDGHQIIGVDIARARVDLVNQGQSPINEEKTGELVRSNVQLGRLEATTDAKQAIEGSEIAVVAVGTPSNPNNGALDTRYVEAVAAEVGTLLQERTKPFLFVLRSTVIPGTTRSRVIPLLEQHSGRRWALLIRLHIQDIKVLLGKLTRGRGFAHVPSGLWTDSALGSDDSTGRRSN